MSIYAASSTAPVNIATLKYWGKRDKTLNLPTNSSISVTLSQKDLRTLTTASTSEKYTKDELYLNGELHPIDSERSVMCLAKLREYRLELELKDASLPKFSQWKLRIISENNFPTAAGLASSAAGFAALISSIAQLYELPQDASELSKIARMGSGSACRSLFGGFVAWEMGDLANGEDSKAVEVAPKAHWPSMKACILVVSDDKKDVPSTSGMQLTVQTSDLFQHRITQVVPKRFIEMKKSIQDRDFAKFAELTIKDSNSFHSVCLDSYPPIFYLNDTSKRIIKLINYLNEKEGELIAAYTFDAGPNAVIYYLQENESKVLGLIHQVLSKVEIGWDSLDLSTLTKFQDPVLENFNDLYKGISRVILTEIGEGPQSTEESLINLETGLPK